ncbi:hypothetical protein V8G54_019567, partial [Vigna mungo]
MVFIAILRIDSHLIIAVWFSRIWSFGRKKQQKAMKVVEVLSIAPSSESKELPTEESFALTFFDILWLRLPPVQRVFFYEFHHPTDVFYDTLLPKLKRSLSLALGHFFPLAGHLTWPTHSIKP